MTESIFSNKSQTHYENEFHYEKENPLRKRIHIMKTKITYENENTLRKSRPIRKTLSASVWCIPIFFNKAEYGSSKK